MPASVATSIAAFSNSSPFLHSISLYGVPTKASLQTLQPSPLSPSSSSSTQLFEDSTAIAASAQAVALANAAAEAARAAVLSALELSEMAFPECSDHDLPLERYRILTHQFPKVAALAAGKRRKKRRKALESFNADPSSRSTQRFSSGSSNSRHLSSREEAELSLYLKEAARLEEVRKRICETKNCEPSMSQWAEAVGMKRGNLERVLSKARECRENITLSYKRLVVTIATPYLGKGLSLQDLVQEGSIGLLKGAERFDHNKGCKLSTYVYWWIKQAIIKAIATKSRIITLPGSMHGLASRIAEANNYLRTQLGRWPTYEEIADLVDVSASTVRLAIERTRLPLSLDQPMSSQGSITLKEVISGLEEIVPEVMVKRQQMKQDIDRLLKTLDEREEHVLRLHFGLNGETARSCDEIGRLVKLSRERVRQIRCTALSKLRNMSMTDSLKAYIV